MTSGAALATLTGRWQSVAGAWLAETQQRTGSDRELRIGRSRQKRLGNFLTISSQGKAATWEAEFCLWLW